VHPTAERVLGHIQRQKLLLAGERAGVAVSGGIDSIALLRLLLELRSELGIVVSVVHFNHKLRGAESESDEQFVAALARHLGLEFHSDSDDVAEHARQQGVSLETAAHELRYGFFRYLLGESGAEGQLVDASSKLDKIVTGHTLDDQAETVLMRMIRGAGLKGLAGIHPRIIVEDDDGELSGEIVRPLLATRRRELEGYLRDIGQDWREDATNADTSFMRNRVRRLLLPLLEKEFNPAVEENLAELAEIARGEEDYWENEVAGWMGTGVHWSEPEWARSARDNAGFIQIAGIEPSSVQVAVSQVDLQSKIDHAPWLVMNASVDRMWFLGEPVAVQRRAIKAIGEHAGIPFEFKHVEEVLRFVSEEAGSGKELSLPMGWKIVRRPEEFVFLTPDLSEPEPSHDYQYDLTVPGEVNISEADSIIEVRHIPDAADAGYNPEHLLDVGSLPGPLKVRNWRAGDRFWPNHTKSPKKVKELLQELHVEQPRRKLWPVVASGNEIVWMRGFPPPARYTAKAGREALMILEKDSPSGNVLSGE
jgi:tRNA(Ile)-lysidine synthase